MSEAKFSEGPWSTCGDWGVKSFGKRDCFASVEDQGEGPSATTEKFANMHLIAAAPEMYNALEHILENQALGSPLALSINNLLSKARGE